MYTFEKKIWAGGPQNSISKLCLNSKQLGGSHCIHSKKLGELFSLLVIYCYFQFGLHIDNLIYYEFFYWDNFFCLTIIREHKWTFIVLRPPHFFKNLSFYIKMCIFELPQKTYMVIPSLWSYLGNSWLEPRTICEFRKGMYFLSLLSYI